MTTKKKPDMPDLMPSESRELRRKLEETQHELSTIRKLLSPDERAREQAASEAELRALREAMEALRSAHNIQLRESLAEERRRHELIESNLKHDLKNAGLAPETSGSTDYLQRPSSIEREYANRQAFKRLFAAHEEGTANLVMIAGPFLGKLYPLVGEEEFTVGRDEKCFIVCDMDNVSRRHAQVFRRARKFFVRDLGSTNGTYLNDEEIREEQPLRSGDLMKIGSAIFKFLSGGNIEQQFYEEIYTLTICDGLTQISNKRYFLEFIEREMGRCHRYNRPLSLMMIDIDHFKKINETNGHLAGDYVLRELAAVIKPRVREEECFARYGAEEFAYVMPELSSEAARAQAEKVRTLVEARKFTFEGHDIKVTVSIGAIDLAPEMTEPLQLIRAAEERLETAKKAGRNRVVG